MDAGGWRGAGSGGWSRKASGQRGHLHRGKLGNVLETAEKWPCPPRRDGFFFFLCLARLSRRGERGIYSFIVPNRVRTRQMQQHITAVNQHSATEVSMQSNGRTEKNAIRPRRAAFTPFTQHVGSV